MSIKVIHTSDWHLGKKLFKQERQEEMNYFIDWLINYINEENIDYLLIAGDLFDVPRPSNEAIEAYYNFVHRLHQETTCVCYAISGNHDSGRFLEAPKELLKNSQMNIIGKLKMDVHQQVFKLYDKQKKYWLQLSVLPYFSTSEILKIIHSRYPELINEDESDEMLLEFGLKKYIHDLSFSETHECQVGKIFMAHHQFGSFTPSGTENSLYASGVSSLPLSEVKKEFDYIALGHIHKYQSLAQDKHVYYSGAPLSFRFGEAHRKYINTLHFEENTLEVKKVKIPQLKQLKILKIDENFESQVDDFCSQNNLLKESFFLQVLISLNQPSDEVLEMIHLKLKKEGLEATNTQIFFQEYQQDLAKPVDSYAPNELFKEFYKAKTNQPIQDKMLKLYESLISEIKSHDH